MAFHNGSSLFWSLLSLCCFSSSGDSFLFRTKIFMYKGRWKLIYMYTRGLQTDYINARYVRIYVGKMPEGWKFGMFLDGYLFSGAILNFSRRKKRKTTSSQEEQPEYGGSSYLVSFSSALLSFSHSQTTLYLVGCLQPTAVPRRKANGPKNHRHFDRRSGRDSSIRGSIKAVVHATVSIIGSQNFTSTVHYCK